MPNRAEVRAHIADGSRVRGRTIAVAECVCCSRDLQRKSEFLTPVMPVTCKYGFTNEVHLNV